MLFTVSSVPNYEKNSREANEYLAKNAVAVFPSEELIKELPLPSDLKIRPYNFFPDACAFLGAVLDFQTRPDDIFVCSTRKSGTTWMHTIIWLLKHNLDYQTAKTVDSSELLPSFNGLDGMQDQVKQLHADHSLDNDAATKMVFHNYIDKFESPRVIKTFYPVYLLPKSIWTNQNKIVYVHRNPKDIAVSEYHYLRAFNNDISLDDVVNGVVNDTWMMSPRLDHVANFWKIRHYKNILFVAYEDLVNEPFATIKQLSAFLECNYTDNQLNGLTQFVSFSNMKNIQTLNREKWLKQVESDTGKERPDPTFRFMRKGKAGTYRDELSESQIEKLDNWIRQMETESGFRYKI